MFDVPGRPPLYSVSCIRLHSNFYSDLRNTSSSELTKYYCVNCHCSAGTMPIRSSSYTTLSTNELVVSVQLPFNSMFSCHAEVLSHEVL